MKNLKALAFIILLVSGVSVLTAGSWQGDKVTTGIDHLDWPGHDNAGFIVHTVGDPSDHLVYAFYVIADPHIGGVDAYPDYNIEGPLPDLDLSKGKTGGEEGSFPGRHLTYAVNLINDHYTSSNEEGTFCVVVGDLANTAEVAEHQHAKMKLDLLNPPWVPIMGNHDTYPYCGEGTWHTIKWGEVEIPFAYSYEWQVHREDTFF